VTIHSKFRSFLCWISAWLIVSLAAHATGPAQQILDSGALQKTPNADLLDYLQGSGPWSLSNQQVQSAREQLVTGLKAQMQGQMADMVSNMMPFAKKEMHQAFSPGHMLSQGLMRQVGLNGGAQRSQAKARQMQQSVQKMINDPWIRGLAAARALAGTGHEDLAASFYERCMRMPIVSPSAGSSDAVASISWVTQRCIAAAIDLGPDAAGQIFIDVYDHAWPDFGINFAAMGGKKPKMTPMPQIRAAAVLGLGRLVAAGDLNQAQRDGILDALLKLARVSKDDHELDATIRALAATRDPRAKDVLHDFSKVELGHFAKFTHKGRRAGKVSEATRRAARQALAVAFHDADAIDALHHEMRHGDPAPAAVAAQALLEIDDAQAWDWADHYLSRDRLKDGEADYRQSVADSVVAAGGSRAADILKRAIAVQRHNDWIEAYYRIALLRLGDASQVEPLQAVTSKTDWQFDLAGARSWYHRLKPLVKEAAKTAMGLSSEKDLAETVLNFALAERDRHLANKAKRQRMTLEIRWDLADALAGSTQPGAIDLLGKLLDDDDSSVRLRAASALLQHDEPQTAPLLAHGLTLDYGSESGQTRSPDIHTAELSKLLTAWPKSEATSQARARAADGPEPAVRFLALAAS
jgi:hypothetical protein